MPGKLFSVQFLFHPMIFVNYLVDHPDGRIDHTLLLGEPEDVVCYSFHVFAPSVPAALAIGRFYLADAVREDYHIDAFADVVSWSCLEVDDD